MNIGIVTTWFERGAAYVSKQFENILSRNHNVYIYARGGEKYAKGNSKWDNDNVTWAKRNIFTYSSKIYIKDFKKWIISNKLDLILFNEQHEWEPVIACRDMNVKIGAYIDFYKKETVQLFKLYDFLICNTKRHYSVFKWHPQVYYVPWGTNVDLFKPKSISNQNDKLVFFHSCGMNPYRKGTDLLLDAFSKLDKDKTKLIIHSQIDLKYYFPRKKDLINKLLSEKSLKLIEKTVSAPGLYCLGDVYVYPSRLDGIGLTIAEAISSGLPVIVTNEQPMNEFVNSLDAGRLVQVHHKEIREDNYYWPQSIIDINDLVKQMNYYIDNINNKHDFKVNARKYAIKHLNWKNNFSKLGVIVSNIDKIIAENEYDLIDKALRCDNRTLKQKFIQGIFYYNFYKIAKLIKYKL